MNNWVTLLTAVLKSDVCKVSRALLQSVASLLHPSAEPGSAAQAHWLWAAWGCVLHACTVADWCASVWPLAALRFAQPLLWNPFWQGSSICEPQSMARTHQQSPAAARDALLTACQRVLERQCPPSCMLCVGHAWVCMHSAGLSRALPSTSAAGFSWSTGGPSQLMCPCLQNKLLIDLMNEPGETCASGPVVCSAHWWNPRR